MKIPIKMDTCEIGEGPQMMVRKISEKWSKVMVNTGCFPSASSVSGDGADTAKRCASAVGWHLSSSGSCLASTSFPAQKGLVVRSASAAPNAG